MRLLVFMLSYLIGISALFVDSKHYLIYLLLLFMYLSATDKIDNFYHRNLIIDPLVISYSSVMLYSLLEHKGDMVFVQFLMMAIFLSIYHHIRGKIANNKKQQEEVNVNFYTKRLVLPIIYPIAFCIVLMFFVSGELTFYIYWMVYFLTIIYFSKYILTAFYFGYFTLIQSAILFYLFQFMDNMMTVEKILVCVFLLFTVIGHYQQQNVKGGNLYLSFVQALFRKKVQEPKNH